MIKLLLLLNMAFADYVCVINVGDLPKLKYKGNTRDEAALNTARQCLSLRIQKYHATRFSPPSQERTILFMENCVNSMFCKKQEIKE